MGNTVFMLSTAKLLEKNMRTNNFNLNSNFFGRENISFSKKKIIIIMSHD